MKKFELGEVAAHRDMIDLQEASLKIFVTYSIKRLTLLEGANLSSIAENLKIVALMKFRTTMTSTKKNK